MSVARSILLFVLAAVAEIGGAWLVWQGVREHRGLLWIGAGVIALGAYGFVATLQPDALRVQAAERRHDGGVGESAAELSEHFPSGQWSAGHR